VRVIAPEAVPDQARVAEAGGMGAPTVSLEKLDAFEPELALRAHMAAGADMPSSQPLRAPATHALRS
jgi:DUF917 family protein